MRTQTTGKMLMLTAGMCLCSFALTGCMEPYEAEGGYVYNDAQVSFWEHASYEERVYVAPQQVRVIPVTPPPFAPVYVPPARDRWNLDEVLTRPIRSASETVGLGGL